jgi:phosphonate transport system ATP-binding protein
VQSNRSRGSSASSSDGLTAAISLEGVSKAYGTLEALGSLDLRIQAGETVGVMGPSGSGKTTLLSMIAGELAPTTGRIALHGRGLEGMRPGRDMARHVGGIHQQFDLVPGLSALQNVLAGRLGEWGLGKSVLSLLVPQDRSVGAAALERVGLADRAHLRASRLSGGEQQRVAIARLLVQDPRIILADEPVASLDPTRADEVLGLLTEATGETGKTLVASLHSVELAKKYMGRLIGLRNGALQFDLPVAAVTDAMLQALYEAEGLRDDP